MAVTVLDITPWDKPTSKSKNVLIIPLLFIKKKFYNNCF